MGNVISSLKVTGSRLLREDVQLDPREIRNHLDLIKPRT